LIIVAGALANKHGQGGEAWVRLSWALGIRKLGWDVLFLEELPDKPDPAAVQFFRETVARFGLETSASLIGPGGKSLTGMSSRLVMESASKARALFNISGHLTFEPVMEQVRPRVYIDIDPGFTQFWQASGMTGARLSSHDSYFTVGRNIGGDGCEIPTCGITWKHIFPPVVLDHWPDTGRPAIHRVTQTRRAQSAGTDGAEAVPGVITNGGTIESSDAEDRLRFTTVANWRGSFGPVQFGAKTYGLKVHEFRKFIELPRQCRETFEIALKIYPGDQKDLEALKIDGWRIVDPAAAASADDFRRYVQESDAEFSVAQGVYVQTNSGWFSDRTAHYLASGKPALVQETGFSRHIPVGEGLLSFRTMDEAIEGAENIAGEYKKHSRAARKLAVEYFNSDRVIGELLTDICVGVKL
jgi:hypothetical protein